MNILPRIKSFFYNIDNLSINSLVSGGIIYFVDNQMAVCGAISLLVGTIITSMSKYNTYKQNKLNGQQEREIEMMRVKMEIKEREALLTNKIDK